MTGDAQAPPGRPGPRHEGDLDGDPEALEDPVHRGDARHQHEVHQHQKQLEKQQGEDAARAAASPDDGD
jgi:hypothetical protein